MVEIRHFFPQQLEALLPPKPRLTQYSESEVEEVTMMDFDITRGSEDSGCSREAYQGRRKGGAGGARAPPIFLKGVQSTPNIYRMSAEPPPL